MRVVMVFGSFDPLHEGHRSLFRQARKHGDYLVAVAARDANIERLKGRGPRASEETRRRRLAEEPLVDEALVGHDHDFLHVIQQKLPDVIVLGYDQTTFREEELRGALKAKNLEPEILRAVAFKPDRYKSSKV